MSESQTTTWQLQTAKNRFSEVVACALAGTPQLVTRHGRPAVYVVAAETYDREVRRHSKREVLLNRPHKEISLEVERSRDPGREVVI